MIKVGFQLPLGHEMEYQDKIAINEFLREITWTAISKSRAYQANAQSVANNTWTQVTLDTENFDLSEEFASNTFTAKNVGYYSVVGNVGFDIAAAAVKEVGAAIYVNGVVASQTFYATDAQTTGTPSSIPVIVPVTDLVYLNPGDTVRLYAFHNMASGTAKNLFTGTSKTFMSVSREITG